MQPIADAALALGARREEARWLMADVFAHAAGLAAVPYRAHPHVRGFGAPSHAFIEAKVTALTDKHEK
jgi:hypothetical protein